MGENKNKDEIEQLKRYIAAAEESLEQAKKALRNVTGDEITSKSNTEMPPGKVIETGKIIEGLFDGENMVGPEGKKYPVPANYASKSKLIEGDRLKLTVSEDGSFIFKQIGPAQRKKLIGVLSLDDNVFHVLAEGKSYTILFASVTYHKAKPGDRVTIVVPTEGESKWAALENIIHDTPPALTEDKEEVFEIPELKKEVEIPAQPEASNQPEIPEPVPAAVGAEATQETPEVSVPEPTAPVLPQEPSIDVPTAGENIQGETTSLPGESFLPRTPDETANNLGEKQLTEEAKQATELEI